MRRYVVKKCHNNCVSSKWPTPLTSLPLPLTFMAASEPSLHTYPVYRTHFCQCSQKVKGNDADAVKECHIERAPSSVNKENRQGITFFPAFSQGVFKQVFMFTKKIAAIRAVFFYHEVPYSIIKYQKVPWSTIKPSLHIYQVYSTHFCQCYQKVAQNEADSPWKAWQRKSPL